MHLRRRALQPAHARAAGARRAASLALVCAVGAAILAQSPAAGVQSAGRASQTATPTARQLERTKLELEVRKLREEITKLDTETDKLDTETDKLEREAGVTGWVGALVTPLAALFAAGSLLVAWRTFGHERRKHGDEQRREREARAEDAIAANRQRLIDAVQAGKGAHAEAVSALSSLKTLLKRLPDEDAPRERQLVTDVLVNLALYDLTFGDFAQAGFDVLCLEKWEPYYPQHWRSDADANEFMLSRYADAAGALVQSNDAAAFRAARWRDRTFEISQHVDEKALRHFTRLAAGYALRVALLEEERRQTAELQFGQAIGNVKLAHDLSRDADDKTAEPQRGPKPAA